MIVEIHMLQNFAPANLNRDDTNSPKDCVFGGYRRARISSQCLKRAIRRHESFQELIQEAGGDVGVRTKRVVGEMARQLVERDHPEDEVERVIENLLTGAALKVEKDKKTQYLLYLGGREISALVDIAHRNWQTLSTVAESDEEEAKANNPKTSGAKKKREAKAKIPADLQKEIAGVFGSYPVADISLFGRMVADSKDMNVDAACQVAHAFSTNEIAMEMDYFTAVDDLLPEGESGSDMIGTVQFNSSCFYRYTKLDLGLLARNLAHDPGLVRAAVRGFLRASVLALPTGKQNSMAAHNPPSYVRVVVRSAGAPWSLANAFLSPIRPRPQDGEDLVSRSVRALETYFGELKTTYGSDGLVGDWCSSVPKREKDLAFADLVEFVVGSLKLEEAGK
jgi:CRISPR system Cascade subunit CasC